MDQQSTRISLAQHNIVFLLSFKSCFDMTCDHNRKRTNAVVILLQTDSRQKSFFQRNRFHLAHYSTL